MVCGVEPRAVCKEKTARAEGCFRLHERELMQEHIRVKVAVDPEVQAAIKRRRCHEGQASVVWKREAADTGK